MRACALIRWQDGEDVRMTSLLGCPGIPAAGHHDSDVEMVSQMSTIFFFLFSMSVVHRFLSAHDSEFIRTSIPPLRPILFKKILDALEYGYEYLNAHLDKYFLYIIL